MKYQDVIDFCELSIAKVETQIANLFPNEWSEEQYSWAHGEMSGYRNLIHWCKIQRALGE